MARIKEIVPLIAIRQYLQGTNRTRLSRMWYSPRHPEAYSRFRIHSSNESLELYNDLLRKRLVDMATLLAYGYAPPRSAFLSTMQYFLDQSSGTVVLPKVLEDLDLSNKKAIAAIFTEPSLYLIQNLQKFLTSTHSVKLKATPQHLLKAAKEVKFPKADRQLFRSSKESVGIYGPNAAATNLASKRKATNNRPDAEKKEANANATEARKSKLAKMTEDERKDFNAKQSENSSARQKRKLDAMTNEERALHWANKREGQTDEARERRLTKERERYHKRLTAMTED